MKSAWIGSGCSHQSVPSLSNTATRSAAGTSAQARATKSMIAVRAGPSDHEPKAWAPSVAGVLRSWRAVAISVLLARHHRDGLALEVHVRLAADVDHHAVERAARERPGRRAGVVATDGVAAVAPGAQA